MTCPAHGALPWGPRSYSAPEFLRLCLPSPMGALPPRSLRSIKSLTDGDAQGALQGWTDKLAPRGGSWPSAQRRSWAGSLQEQHPPRASQVRLWDRERGGGQIGHGSGGEGLSADSDGASPGGGWSQLRAVESHPGRSQCWDRANNTHSNASGFPHPAARSPKTDKQQTQEPTYFLYLPYPVGPAFHEDPLS